MDQLGFRVVLDFILPIYFGLSLVNIQIGSKLWEFFEIMGGATEDMHALQIVIAQGVFGQGFFNNVEILHKNNTVPLAQAS